MKWARIRKLIPQKERTLIWESITVYIVTLEKMQREGKDHGMPAGLIDELNALRRNIADKKLLEHGANQR